MPLLGELEVMPDKPGPWTTLDIPFEEDVLNRCCYSTERKSGRFSNLGIVNCWEGGSEIEVALAGLLILQTSKG